MERRRSLHAVDGSWTSGGAVFLVDVSEDWHTPHALFAVTGRLDVLGRALSFRAVGILECVFAAHGWHAFDDHLLASFSIIVGISVWPHLADCVTVS